jgi:3-deoxy-manno-octulosonate cytidylyltransferase (CMP-KDO synthetase)
LTFKVYIPARYGATRLPGKPLLDIGGKPLLQHVWERACASGAAEVVIATDDGRIAEAAAAFGAITCMTAPELPSGTDRIAAAARARGEAPERIIVNLQGDEPSMPPAVIRQVAALAASGECDLASVCEPLAAAQLFDPNVVKVVRDDRARALYFSRAPIPWSRDEYGDGARVPATLAIYRRHVGLYAYRVGFLARFVAAPPGTLEQIERLEQLRALAFGAIVRVADAVAPCGTGIDTPADLEEVRRRHAATDRSPPAGPA